MTEKQRGLPKLQTWTEGAENYNKIKQTSLREK
jgi:hypothetical protein